MAIVLSVAFGLLQHRILRPGLSEASRTKTAQGADVFRFRVPLEAVETLEFLQSNVRTAGKLNCYTIELIDILVHQSGISSDFD